MRSEVHDLLDEIQTIDALEVMCAVVREPFRRWQLAELPRTDGPDRAAFPEAIRHLLRAGLLQLHADGTVQSGLTGARTTAMHALCRMCDEDRPNVLGMIAQRSVERVRAAAARSLAVSRTRG